MPPTAWEAHENAYNAVRAYGEGLLDGQGGGAINPDQERLLVALDAIVQCLAAAITEANRDLLAQQAATIVMLEKKFRVQAEHSNAEFLE